MDSILRLLSFAAGIPIFGNGIMFIVDPGTAARQLGMPLLEGMGRSTQIGDFGSFFLCSSIAAFFGAWNRSPVMLYVAALLIGGAAICRMIASALHDAPFATTFIVVELVLATIWVVSARYFHQQHGKFFENVHPAK
jgi:hypothetical protein